MAGIYIHIPYCRQACSYCNFHFSTLLHSTDQMLDAILEELRSRQGAFSGVIFDTIYIGGGTPSVLSTPQLRRLLDALRTHLSISQREFTFEINPNDVSPSYLQDLKTLGVDRLSIGFQTFAPSLLSLLHRNHTPSQALDTLSWVASVGFRRVSADLIYGIPTQSEAQLQTDLDHLSPYPIDHLSAYALTLEPKTAWYVGLPQKKYPPIDEDQQYRHFELIRAWAKARGWEHYETSNFAAVGARSRHNQAYWGRAPYLGLGPSAHSFDGKGLRSWNVSHNARYIKAPDAQQCERLSPADHINETLMLGLRRVEGVDLAGLRQLCQAQQYADLQTRIQRGVQRGQLFIAKDRLRLTPTSLFHCDGIAASLFV